jgi:cell division septation protein DedD
MKHSMVTFRLHRTAVIFIIIGSLLAALLIFAGGYFLAMRRRPDLPVAPTITAAAPAPAVATAPPAPKVDLLAVRVGIFDSEDEAKALAQGLAARKLDAIVVPMTTSEGVKLFTVEVGQYITREAAAAAATSLKDDEGLQGAVVPAGR